jgi:ABC-2 type transport system permease protein
MKRSIAAAFVIAGKDLQLRIRDRSAIVLGIVAPLAIAGLMSVAFKGTANFHTSVAVSDQDHGPVAASFLRVLRSPDLRSIVHVRTEPTAAAAADDVKKGRTESGIVIPAGLSRAVTTTGAASIDVLTSVDNQLSGQVTRAIVENFAAQVDADRVSVATAVAAGAPAQSRSRLAALVANLQVPESVALQPVGAKQLSVISYYAPAMGIFFLMFAITWGARSFYSERTDGTLDRVVAAPIPPSTVLAGKALSVFVYSAVSLATIAVVTSVFFGADWGGPLPAALLCVVMAIAIVCLTALVIGISRTDRQAEAIGSIIVFGLALLGGSFINVSGASASLRRLALFTPNGWALRGFTDLATGAGSHAVLEPVVAILGFSAVVGAIAVLFARRTVVH